MAKSNLITFEITHFYPDFDQQKFWDFLVDQDWYNKSSIMPGEITIVKSGKGHLQGLGATRRIKIEKIEITEDIVGFEAPRYFSYAVHEGGMPVSEYRGEFFMEPHNGGLLFRYKGSFKPKALGINWLFKWLFRSRIKSMIPIWEKGYMAYHEIGGKNEIHQ